MISTKIPRKKSAAKGKNDMKIKKSDFLKMIKEETEKALNEQQKLPSNFQVRMKVAGVPVSKEGVIDQVAVKLGIDPLASIETGYSAGRSDGRKPFEANENDFSRVSIIPAVSKKYPKGSPLSSFLYKIDREDLEELQQGFKMLASARAVSQDPDGMGVTQGSGRTDAIPAQVAQIKKVADNIKQKAVDEFFDYRKAAVGMIARTNEPGSTALAAQNRSRVMHHLEMQNKLHAAVADAQADNYYATQNKYSDPYRKLRGPKYKFTVADVEKYARNAGGRFAKAHKAGEKRRAQQHAAMIAQDKKKELEKQKAAQRRDKENQLQNMAPAPSTRTGTRVQEEINSIFERYFVKNLLESDAFAHKSPYDQASINMLAVELNRTAQAGIPNGLEMDITRVLGDEFAEAKTSYINDLNFRKQVDNKAAAAARRRLKKAGKAGETISIVDAGEPPKKKKLNVTTKTQDQGRMLRRSGANIPSTINRVPRGIQESFGQIVADEVNKAVSQIPEVKLALQVISEQDANDPLVKQITDMVSKYGRQIGLDLLTKMKERSETSSEEGITNLEAAIADEMENMGIGVGTETA